MTSTLFCPRLDSHFTLSALATELVEPELRTMQTKQKPSYEVKPIVGSPMKFDIKIYKKRSRLEEGTKKIRKIVHETVASLLGQETDVKLHTIGVRGGDANLSPDFIDPAKKLVVELTTTTNSDPRNVEERFAAKMVHYKDALKETGYGVGIAVVGETFVYSNLAMSQQMVDALCQRCRIGIAIKSVVESILGYTTNVEDSSEKENLVRNVIMSMKEDPASSSDFPIADILSCANKPSREDYKITKRILAAELKASKTASRESDADLQKYIDSYTGSCRTDLKRICNVPCVEPVSTYSEAEFTWEEVSASNAPNFLKEIWRASMQVSAKKEESLETLVAESMMSVDYDQHRIQKRSAFNVKLDREDLEAASTTGLWGKAHKSLQMYRENKTKNKLSFHPTNTDTRDIEAFIKTVNLMEPSTIVPLPQSIDKLIADAKRVWTKDEKDPISRVIMNRIVRTRMVAISSMITDLFTEICYCYKYWIGRSDFYRKEIDDVKILIRCTGTHIFCAFAFPKDRYSKFDTGRLGPTLFESPNYWLSDFASYTEPVVEHFVKSGPYIASLIAHQMCSLEMDLDEPLANNKNLRFDMNGIFLLFLNNKTDAEEIMTNQRYLTMTVLEDLDPNPFRFTERLPGFIKSRLSAFLTKRTIELMIKYKNPPIRIMVKEGDVSTMEYDGLVSFFGNEPITFRRKIEEFYYGYVISKEKGRGGDRNFKIMSKIVQQEFKYRDDNHAPFSKSADTKTNQTNLPVLRVLCHLMKERFAEHFGSNWKEVMERKIIERLSRLSFMEVATLKVSSRNYDGEFRVPPVDNTMSTEEIREKLTAMNPEDVAARPRVMESLTSLIAEYLADTGRSSIEHIIQLVPWCLDKLETRGYFYSDIFPKPQHGGDREIHVLEIKARICQLYVETIARSLCDMTPSDTLTHPKWKMSFVKNHYSRAEQELDTHRITMGKSADASKWCQRNHASKFAAMFSSFLPPWMVKSVHRILFLWTTKIICFPIQFVANFISNKDVKSNPIYERMREEFFTGTGIFPKPICNRMLIKSGMMQGILHYTSSFMHGIVQESMGLLQKVMLRRAGIDSVITLAQGSDDSAELISLSGKPIKTLVRIATTMLHWKENMSRHVSIYTSRAKSCIGSTDMIEYNSEWYVRQNSVMPTFRWVSACMEVGVVEKFIDRIHNFYGTATNVIEAGGKILEVAIIQQCQAWMHYLMLGLQHHPMRDLVSDDLIELKDPSLGYFPLDSDYNAGVTGVDFQLYKYHKDSSYGYGVGSNRLQKAELEMFDEDTKDPSVSQSLRRVQLKFGNHRIFTTLLRRMSAPELDELVKIVEEHPRILYYPPDQWEESKVRIFMKLFEPGVKESLSRHSATARILSASAYMISRPCLTRSGTDEKVSLYKAIVTESLDRLRGKSKKIPVEDVFLYHSEYQDTLKDIEAIQNNNVMQKVNMRSRSKQVIQVFDRIITDVPVIEMCKEKWFGKGNLPFSKRQFEIKWAELKDRFTFLADSRSVTKENLGMNEIQLKNFLVSIDSRPRKLSLMDTAARGSSVKSTMTRLFWPNIKLLKTTSTIEEEETVSELRSKLFSVLTHWSSSSEKKKTIISMISQSKVLAQRNVPAKARKLKCMRDLLMGVPKTKIIDSIITEKIGSLGVFTVRQNGWGKNRTGYGEWKGIVLSTNVKMEFDGPVCTKITVSNLLSKAELGRSLLELIRNFNSTFPTNAKESDHWLSPDGVINGGRGIMSAIPMEVQDDLKVTIFDDVVDWDWFLDTNYNSIRIRADSGQNMVITLISDTIRSYEWDPIYRMEDNVFGDWNNSEPMNIEDIGAELAGFFNGGDGKTLKELNSIERGSSNSLSASGWYLRDFRDVLRSFFHLRSNPPSEDGTPRKLEFDLDPISEDDLMFFQTGSFDVEDTFLDEVMAGEEDFEFDVNFDVEQYIDDSIELLLAEREVSQKTSMNTMPPTNRCLANLNMLCTALTNQSLQEVYLKCVQDSSVRFSGLLGKILTLVTGTPRVKSTLTEVERIMVSKEEDSISATQSLRTVEDLSRLSAKELKENIEELDMLLTTVKNAAVKESLLLTRARYVNMLSLMNVPNEQNSVSKIPSRDFLLWFRQDSGFRNQETNILFRLSESAYILSIRDRLDSHVEEMCKRAEISEFELGLYRESIPKPHLTTMFLDVFSSYFKISLKVGPYTTSPDQEPDYVYP